MTKLTRNGSQLRGPWGRRQFLRAACGAAVGAAVSNAATADTTDSAPGAASDHTADPAGPILDVVIVGAGLAGLTAARDLARAGNDGFVVLEANDRVGGRTLNHDLGDGYVSEAGGQWIGPGQTAIANLARELGIGTFPTYYQGKTLYIAGENGRAAEDLHGTLGTDLALAAELDELARDVPSGAPWAAPRAAELDTMSIGDWLARQNLDAQARVGWNMSSFLTTGTMPAKMGLLHFLSMINSAGSRYEQLDSIKDSAQETRIEGGSQILSIEMARSLGDRVRLSCPVRRIRAWDRDVVQIDTDRGTFRARQVVMALSPALCQQIEFAPGLPAARQALQRYWPAHSPARKTAHVYARPFWRERGLNGHIMQPDGPVLWAYDNSPPDGSIGVINAFVVQSMVPADPQGAEAMLTDIYVRALGEQARQPLQFHDHDWGLSPWTISCVSAIPPGFWTRHGKALHPGGRQTDLVRHRDRRHLGRLHGRRRARGPHGRPESPAITAGNRVRIGRCKRSHRRVAAAAAR